MGVGEKELNLDSLSNVVIYSKIPSVISSLDNKHFVANKEKLTLSNPIDFIPKYLSISMLAFSEYTLNA